MTGPTKRLDWRKGSTCASATCVEVAKGGGGILVRDSKNPAVVLTFTLEEWAAFMDAAEAGEFRF